MKALCYSNSANTAFVDIFMINEHSFQAEGLSDKHKLLFAQRKAEFLQDFGEDVAALDAAEKEVRLLSIRMIRVFNG